MSTFREALVLARHGRSIFREGCEVRFLTKSEAEPFLLEHAPRRVVHDDGVTAKSFVDPFVDLKTLGLHRITADGITPFVPDELDRSATWSLEPIVPHAHAHAHEPAPEIALEPVEHDPVTHDEHAEPVEPV